MSTLPNTSKIKIHLLESGLTQTALATRLGISKQYMCDILRGRRKPKPIINKLVNEFRFSRSLFEKGKGA